MLEIPYGESAVCETPLDSEWSSEALEFWKKLTGLDTDSFEGNLASNIHNPTIRVFCYLLACIIFGRKNPNKINAKELLFLQGSLVQRKMNFVPFMLAHMCVIRKKGGIISFGGLITSIDRALHADTELDTLEPLPPRIINLIFLKDMRLCKVRKEGGFNLMVHNVTIPSVVLPCSRRTNVRLKRNWIYDLQAPPFTGPFPPNVPFEEGDGTDDEYGRRDQSPVPTMPSHHASPAHTAPSFTHPSTGTSSGFHITEEMWQELQALEERRDVLLSAMNQQLKDNMDFMRESQRQTDSSLRSIIEPSKPSTLTSSVSKRTFRDTLPLWSPLKDPY